MFSVFCINDCFSDVPSYYVFLSTVGVCFAVCGLFRICEFAYSNSIACLFSVILIASVHSTSDVLDVDNDSVGNFYDSVLKPF